MDGSEHDAIVVGKGGRIIITGEEGEEGRGDGGEVVGGDEEES